MRILIVNDYTEAVGGVEVYDEHLTTLLRERGHTVRMVGGERGSHPFARFIRSFYSWRYRREITNEVDDFEPDIVFAHSICYNVSPSFLPAVKKRGIPVILTVPELAQLEYRFPNLPAYFIPASFLRKFIQRRFLERYVDAFIAPSTVAAEHVSAVFDSEEVYRIPHPAFWELESEPIDRDDDRILFVGRLDINKGVETLISAFSELINEYGVDAILEIVGDGPAEKTIQEGVVGAKIEANVQFRGRLENDLVRERYRAASVFVLPSVIPENCPMTIVEAFSQGTPIITTDIGGQKELVNGYGILVEPKDSRALAEAFLEVLTDESLRRALSNQSRERAQDFAPDEHARRLEELFINLVNTSQ